MDVSSLLQNSNYYGYYQAKSSTNSQSVTTQKDTDEQKSFWDSVSSQSEMKPPPSPPQEMDFQNISDDDLRVVTQTCCYP